MDIEDFGPVCSTLPRAAHEKPTSNFDYGVPFATQWMIVEQGVYEAAGPSAQQIESGAYSVTTNRNGDIQFRLRKLETDDLIYFEDSLASKTIREVREFWKKSAEFKKYGFLHRMGILFYGPPGGGKTGAISQIVNDTISDGGVVFYCERPDLHVRAMELFRKVEPTRNMVNVFEDIDSIIQEHGDSELLQLLDGNHDLDNVINLATCHTPDTRMLTQDLRWVPCGELKVGDKLWAFDADRPKKRGARRRFRLATVLVSHPARKKCVRVFLDTGESYVCTYDHPWLSSGDRQIGSFRLQWTLAKDLLQRPNLVRTFLPWERENSWDSGWLSGIIDGEGSLAKHTALGRASMVTVAQNYGPTATRIADAIISRVPAKFYERRTRKKMMVVETLGGYSTAAKLIGQVNARRLVEMFDLEGRMMLNKFPSRVVAVEPVGVRTIQSIQTSTGTYIAEGFASHNTNYPENLDRRIVARPRRFSHIIKVESPSESIRRVYFTKKLTPHGQEGRVEDFVAASVGFSFAALSDLVIMVFCMGYKFEDAVNQLQKLTTQPPSSRDFEEGVGFRRPSNLG